MSSGTDPAPEFPLFGGHQWVFWPVALLPAVTLLLSHPCMKNGNWPASMLLTVMLMACLWEAHAQALRFQLAGKGMLWHVCKRTFKTLRSVTFAGLLPFILLGFILLQYSCYRDQSRVSAAVSEVYKPKQEIAYRASVNKTLKGAGLGVEFPKLQGSYPSTGFVLEDGVIVLIMEKPPAAVLFTPKLLNADSGAIEWACRGYPSKSVPAKCREPG